MSPNAFQFYGNEIMFFCFCFVSIVVTGTCLFTYGLKLGELCSRDADCESGLVCETSDPNGLRVCQAPMAVAKQYSDDCLTSSDCDITRYESNTILFVYLSCGHIVKTEITCTLYV